jgi:hypothetical protein
VQGHRDCEPQRPGFNTQCNQGNHARWGFCNNIPSQDCQTEDANDADGVIAVFNLAVLARDVRAEAPARVVAVRADGIEARALRLALAVPGDT